MINYDVLVKPQETLQDLIAEICVEYNVGPDEPFAFGAIMKPVKTENCYNIRINALDTQDVNPYTPRSLIIELFSHPEPASKIRYVQPPIEDWLREFQPLLYRMVEKAYPHYSQLLSDREDLLSILYLVVIKLHNRGYYLHNNLVFRSFINELNLECRKIKGASIVSFDESLEYDEEGKPIALIDQLADPDATKWADSVTRYNESDFWEDTYEQIKSRMLQDMSEFQFKRIMVQLATNTVDRNTSYVLDKYRKIFNPNYVPRPNARGKNKGGKKVNGTKEINS